MNILFLCLQTFCTCYQGFLVLTFHIPGLPRPQVRKTCLGLCQLQRIPQHSDRVNKKNPIKMFHDILVGMKKENIYFD